MIGSALMARSGIGEEIPQVAHVVTYGPGSLWLGQEGTAHNAGILSAVQKVRE